MWSCKYKKGTKIAHVEAGNVLPPIAATESYENVPKKATGKALKNDLLRNLPKENKGRLKNFLKV